MASSHSLFRSVYKACFHKLEGELHPQHLCEGSGILWAKIRAVCLSPVPEKCMYLLIDTFLIMLRCFLWAKIRAICLSPVMFFFFFKLTDPSLQSWSLSQVFVMWHISKAYDLI
jgi:hypothetical protein